MTAPPGPTREGHDRVSIVNRIKSLVVPHGEKPRRLVSGPGKGLVMNLDLTFQTRLWLGLYETELNDTLRQLCQPGTKAFDIGGQFGYDALILAKLTGAEVVTVDCEDFSIAAMKANIALNPGMDRLVQPRQAFIAQTSDSATRHLSIDDLAAETFTPGLMKIDIEGGEVDALHGAAAVLRDAKPFLLIEVHTMALEEECVSILHGLGYQTRLIDQRKILADHRPIEHNRWLVAQAR